MELNQVEKKFEKLAFITPGVFLIPSHLALGFIEECRLSGFAVLGAEAFRRFGDRIQPVQEHSIDYEDEPGDHCEALSAFLRPRLGLGLWFEVICEPASSGTPSRVR